MGLVLDVMISQRKSPRKPCVQYHAIQTRRASTSSAWTRLANGPTGWNRASQSAVVMIGVCTSVQTWTSNLPKLQTNTASCGPEGLTKSQSPAASFRDFELENRTRTAGPAPLPRARRGSCASGRTRAWPRPACSAPGSKLGTTGVTCILRPGLSIFLPADPWGLFRSSTLGRICAKEPTSGSCACPQNYLAAPENGISSSVKK